MNQFNLITLERIRKYTPENGWDQTSRFFLHVAEQNGSKEDLTSTERAALLCEKTAKILGINERDAYFSGLFYTAATKIFPAGFWAGQFKPKEYSDVNDRVVAGLEILKGSQLFYALCSAAHFRMFDDFYGFDRRRTMWSAIMGDSEDYSVDITAIWKFDRIKDIVINSNIISACISIVVSAIECGREISSTTCEMADERRRIIKNNKTSNTEIIDAAIEAYVSLSDILKEI